MRKLLWAMMVMVPVPGLAAGEWRTFTSVDDRQIVAKIVKIEGNRVVVELQADGRQLPIDFAQLSQEDIEYINDARMREVREVPDVPPAAAAAAGGPAANGLYPRSKDEIRAGIHRIEKEARPDGVGKDVYQATRLLNIYRFLCGVPSDVKADAECSKGATDAALACKKNGGLSHALGHSTDKCNLSSSGNIIASVSQYMADSGDNNRDARGHRAWCLNPPMGKVGFGTGGDSYSAMWCMDSSGKAITGTWAYPGKGFFPLEYLQGNAWSLYGAGGTGAADKLKVEVVKLSHRPTQPFPATGEIPGRKIRINHVSTGMNAINFEPEEPNNRGIYWVRVSGDGVNEGYLVDLY